MVTNPHHVQLDVLVVGGGIAGLTAALALRQQGHAVTVVESSSWLREAGAAVAVPPNSLCALTQLGIDVKRDAKGVVLRSSREYRFDSPDQIPKFGEDGDGRPTPYVERAKDLGLLDSYFLVHRVDLHDALKEKCLITDGQGHPVKIFLSSRVVAWNTNGSIKLHDGRDLQGDLVVAADGIHSCAHEQILGRHISPVPSGLTAMRLLLKTRDILSDAATAPLMDDGPGCFTSYTSQSSTTVLVRYSCQNDELQNFAAYAHPDVPPTLQGEQVSKAALLARLASFPQVIRAVINKSEDFVSDWKVADREPISSYQKDRLVLIGDAAHPMWPRQGQGASQAIEDAATLGVLMGDLQDESEIPSRLKLFDRLRVRRTSAVQLLSRARELGNKSSIAKTGAGPLAEAATRVFEQFPVENGKNPSSYDEFSRWIWAYDCVAEARALLHAQGKETSQVQNRCQVARMVEV